MRIFCGVCGILAGLYGLYYVITCFGGLLLRKPEAVPRQAPCTRIAAVVAARNEANVIENLIESLNKQEYPPELFDIYVVPNNCTDETEKAARNAGAIILKCDAEVASKGEVLRSAFAQLSETGQYDAYCVFDADNLVSPTFFRAVNDTRLAGYDVAQGFRDSKNPYDNWISGSTSVFYWFMSRFFNESRARLGMTCMLNGTGFMVSDELIRKIGWDTKTLTEDLEFSALCALQGYRVGWMREARIYDEQPTRFRDSVSQRRRWTSGSFQCMKSYAAQLIRRKSVHSLDMAALFLGNLLNIVGLFTGMVTIHDIAARVLPDPAVLRQTLPLLVLVGAIYWSICSAAALILYRMEGKLCAKSIPTIILFPIYLVSWLPINVVACLTRPPKWKEIQHIRGITISDLSEQQI